MIYKQGFWDTNPPEDQTAVPVEDALPLAIEGARRACTERGFVMVAEPLSATIIRPDTPEWPVGHYMVRLDVNRRPMTDEELAARPPIERPESPPPTALQLMQAQIDELKATMDAMREGRL